MTRMQACCGNAMSERIGSASQLGNQQRAKLMGSQDASPAGSCMHDARWRQVRAHIGFQKQNSTKEDEVFLKKGIEGQLPCGYWKCASIDDAPRRRAHCMIARHRVREVQCESRGQRERSKPSRRDGRWNRPHKKRIMLCCLEATARW